jgi:nucleotide-binding universal stress UspA family protein
MKTGAGAERSRSPIDPDQGGGSGNRLNPAASPAPIARHRRSIEMLRTIFVPLAQDATGEPALEAAFEVARRMESHVRAVFIRPNPDAIIYQVPESIAAIAPLRDAIERDGRHAAAEAKACFEAWRSRHALALAPGDDRVLNSRFASWTEMVGEIEAIVTRLGRVSDLIVMTRFLKDATVAARCLDAALFGSGRPTLLVPDAPIGNLLDHVMIAWNGSLEASHAVFGALPLLRAANRVSMFRAGEPDGDPTIGAELVEALSWYGIRVTAMGAPESPSATGPALLARARQMEASLIVMGAYTHSRLRQTFLGGVTRHILEASPIPVLLSH